MLRRELATCIASEAGLAANRRLPERRRGSLALLTAVTSGLMLAREPQTARQRFEQELRTLTRARSCVLREDGSPAGGVCVDVPSFGAESRARIEVAFDPERKLDVWTHQLLEAAAQVAALLLEVERARTRYSFPATLVFVLRILGLLICVWPRSVISRANIAKATFRHGEANELTAWLIS